MLSPTQRSMAFLRERGWEVDIWEHWVTLRDRLGNATNKGVRKDGFGFVDIVGVHFDYPGTTYFQVTSLSNISARRNKIYASTRAEKILLTNNRIVIHGWGQRSGRWGVVEEEVKLSCPLG
jgi:hypothetical protein